MPQPWLDVGAVLPWFGPTPTQARRAYRRYVAEGVPLGRRPELVGGGLIRSAGGWAVVQAWRRLGAATAADPQILGTGDFAQRVIAEAEAQRRPQPGVRRRPQAAARLIRAVSTRAGIGEAELRTGSRRRPVAQRRVEVARTLVRTLGFSLADAARELGVSTSAICRALQKPGDK